MKLRLGDCTVRLQTFGSRNIPNRMSGLRKDGGCHQLIGTSMSLTSRRSIRGFISPLMTTRPPACRHSTYRRERSLANVAQAGLCRNLSEGQHPVETGTALQFLKIQWCNWLSSRHSASGNTLDSVSDRQSGRYLKGSKQVIRNHSIVLPSLRFRIVIGKEHTILHCFHN